MLLIAWQKLKEMPEYSVLDSGEYSTTDLVMCYLTDDDIKEPVAQFEAKFVKDWWDVYSE